MCPRCEEENLLLKLVVALIGDIEKIDGHSNDVVAFGSVN